MMKPGTKVDLTILRKDKLMQIPLEVGNYAEETLTSGPQKSQLGIEVENLNSDTARSLGYNQEEGVVVTKVNPNRIAGFAGLEKRCSYFSY